MSSEVAQTKQHRQIRPKNLFFSTFCANHKLNKLSEKIIKSTLRDVFLLFVSYWDTYNVWTIFAIFEPILTYFVARIVTYWHNLNLL